VTGNTIKPIVVLVPGPLHLFWTTGVYYLWELSKQYRILLVVAENYRKNSLFIKVCELCNVIDICYLIDNYGVFKRHMFYSRAFSKLADKYSPIFVLQHNHVYPINIYLYHWFKNKNNHIITIQMGREAMNWDHDFSSRKAFTISNMKRKYPILPYWMISIMQKIRRKILFFLEYFLLPFIFLRKIFQPGLDVYSGKIFKQNSENYHDYHLMYKTNEKEVTEKVMGQSEKIVLIRHPVETTGQECNNVLYPLDVEENRITIFPSYGFVDVLCAQKGIKQDEVKELITRKWSEIIEVMHTKLPDWELLFKLHPNSATDIIWQNILKSIKSNCPDIVVLNESEKAEKWILKSKIVVSDVSTVLWWTSFLRSKLAISLDLFGYPGGNDMEKYDDVYYISSMDQFKKTDLSVELSKKKEKLDRNLREKNSLLDILKNNYTQKW
jgi:hypothetical protein